MKLFERSLKFQFGIVCFFILYSTIQLIINSLDTRHTVLVIIHSLLLAVLGAGAVLLALDLVRKDELKIAGKIVFLEEYRLHILRLDGKLKKVRVRAAEYKQFHLNQAVELHITRTSGLLIAIHSTDNQSAHLVHN